MVLMHQQDEQVPGGIFWFIQRSYLFLKIRFLKSAQNWFLSCQQSNASVNVGPRVAGYTRSTQCIRVRADEAGLVFRHSKVLGHAPGRRVVDRYRQLSVSVDLMILFVLPQSRMSRASTLVNIR